MYLSDFKNLVSNLAVLTTVLQFLSGTLVCRQYVNNRSTGESSALPFLFGILSSGLWLLYGLTKHDDKIVLVNIIGVSLMASYTAVFYIYTIKKTFLLKQLLIIAFFDFFILGYIFRENDNSLLLSRLGLLSCTFSLMTIAAPMSKLMFVMKVKSTECLPFPMILMSFFVSSLWFLYGVIEEDVYLSVPNFIGALLALSQLSLFLIYPSIPVSPSLVKTIMA